MAERLTKKNQTNFRGYVYEIEYNDEAVIVTTDIEGNDYVVGKAVDKLAQLEDILEKYGIDSVEELENKIIYYEQNKDMCLGLANDIERLVDDRDTWKKACELACRYLEATPFKQKSEKRVKQIVEFYYQQAKEKIND